MLDCSREEVVAAVDRFIEELLTAASWVEPPVDAIRLAQQHLGMTIALDRDQPGRGRAQRSKAGKQIFVRPEPTEERHQWTVAHEIGEHLREQLYLRIGIEPGEGRPMMGESLANLFAQRLLVPAVFLAADVRSLDHDLLQLKERFRTASHEVIAWRLLDLPEPCVITIVDNDRVTRRRSNAWPVNRKLHAVEQTCQRQVSQQGRPRRLQADGWTVQGWPIHKPDWKREILRSVWGGEG